MVKRAIISLLAAVIALVSLHGQAVRGDGKVITESRPAKGFSSISMSGAGQLAIRRGPSFKVSVSLDRNLQPYYEASVSGGVLKLGFRALASVGDITRLEVVVTLPALDGLALSGACEASLADEFPGPRLALSSSGAGKISGRVSCRELSLSLSGSSRARLEGRADALGAELSGACELEGKGLAVKRLKAGLTGASRLSASVSERLEAKASGASSITYFGNPATSISASGASSVRKG